MAVLSGRLCTKVCFHWCFSGRYFLWAGLKCTSLNSWSNGQEGHSCRLFSTCFWRLLNPNSAAGLLPTWVNSTLAPFLSASVPISVCGCAYDTEGINQESLNSWETGTNLLNSFLSEAADGCADAWASGFVYPHGATEMKEGRAIMAAYPVCRFSISVFPGSLPNPAWISAHHPNSWFPENGSCLVPATLSSLAWTFLERSPTLSKHLRINQSGGGFLWVLEPWVVTPGFPHLQQGFAHFCQRKGQLCNSTNQIQVFSVGQHSYSHPVLPVESGCAIMCGNKAASLS